MAAGEGAAARVPLLRKYMSDRGKIRSRRVTGNCAQHQRAIASAIKTARELVLLPYVVRTFASDKGDRRGGLSRRPAPSEPSSVPDSAESGSAAGALEPVANGFIETGDDDDEPEQSVVLAAPGS